jgi:hypothetical protein
MPQHYHYHVFSADHEFPGQVVIDLANAVGSDEIMPYLEKHGMTNVDPKAWYPMQKMVDIYNDMADNMTGTMFDFVAIGMKEAEQAIVPPQFAAMSLLDILKGVDTVYKLNNRGTDPGEIRCEVVTDKHVKLILRVVTPDDLWYGVLYGYVKRFAPKGSRFSLRYDPDVPRREEGGEATIIHVQWE